MYICRIFFHKTQKNLQMGVLQTMNYAYFCTMIRKGNITEIGESAQNITSNYVINKCLQPYYGTDGM